MPFLQSISSFFSGQPADHASTSRQNRRTALDSTFDAFSLPSSRYGEGGRLGADPVSLVLDHNDQPDGSRWTVIQAPRDHLVEAAQATPILRRVKHSRSCQICASTVLTLQPTICQHHSSAYLPHVPSYPEIPGRNISRTPGDFEWRCRRCSARIVRAGTRMPTPPVCAGILPRRRWAGHRLWLRRSLLRSLPPPARRCHARMDFLATGRTRP